MHKDFDGWNKKKHRIESAHRLVYAHPREVWWCALGVNIGAEINGKSKHFGRAAIIMKVYNKETIVILPIVAKKREDLFHFEIERGKKTTWVKLTQTRTISHKRLLRKLGVLDEKRFEALRIAWKKLL